ncbi:MULTISPECIES: DUF4278 domain-containing protein [unclassified Leptolyngbya]|uniref:DUF4278 domain-containing protein n=1 Tax=unclassified Leptolyngbya TaxID=2650499 RepID=UPI001683DD03|nr:MULTISPECIES: DUF4278 domain-containing protein [unclassified Leptolyngbya]MBD1914103.1 DUF4278 domain-containing protein [Leptolyngbya sp. FACHB-8]MBD2157300.1 DUF4278 domain-containing protein [Leptolyngbya sp. FACHB-16]
MKLVYRGVRYDAVPAQLDVADAPVTGQYRGATVHFHQAAKLPVVQRVLHLIYRGVEFDEAIATPTA